MVRARSAERDSIDDILEKETEEEFDALKREIEEMKKLLMKAKEYDERTGQPDCEMDDKVELLRKIEPA